MQVHACCQLNDQVEPSVRIQFHVEVQVPVAAAADVAEVLLAAALGASAATAAGLCQIQFQVEPTAETAVGSLPSVGGVHCPSHTQFHSHVSSTETPAGCSGSTRATVRFVPVVVVTRLWAAVVPDAVALLTCVTAPSVPGLPTRIETLAFNAPVWLEAAVPVVGACALAAAPGPGSSGDSGNAASMSCSMYCSSVPTFATPAVPLVVTVCSVPAGGDAGDDAGGEAASSATSPAVAAAVFDCVTAPLFPGLPTRMVAFTFLGAFCVADAAADPPPFAWLPATAVAVFVWSTAPTSPLLPTSTETFVF